MASEYAQLKLLAKEIPRGTTANGQECPFCKGGKHGERALSITHRPDGVVLFICHRASCSKAGRVFVNGQVSVNLDINHGPEFKARPWTGNSRSLDSKERELLDQQYGLTFREINWHRLSMTEDGRLLFKIVGPAGQLRGHILRTLPGESNLPKAETYKELNEPFAGWFWTETSSKKKIILVEDCLSAIRAARQFYSVALLGTNLSMDNMMELLKFSDHLVLALDKDATKKALDYQQKYKFIAPQLAVAILDKDLKHLPDNEIKERIPYLPTPIPSIHGISQ